MEHSPDEVLRFLERHRSRTVLLALSGGRDSVVLLHTLAILRNEYELQVRAVHVDHGLHPDSMRWAARCIEASAALGIPCEVLKVAVDTTAGREAGARQARYAALAICLEPGEDLVTAHHADDQAESVLLALMRGSGPAGLAAMPEAVPFGRGRLLRPLLGMSRAALARWALSQSLVWVDDPSNDDRSLARNHLRHAVLPALEAYWPAAVASISRSAGLSAEADALLAILAREDIAECTAPDGRLDAEAVLALGSIRIRNLLRTWLMDVGLDPPPFERLHEAERQLREAAPERVPEIRWPGGILRRWAGALFAEGEVEEIQADWQMSWDGSSPLELPAGLGRLGFEPAETGIPASSFIDGKLTVRFRQGGERLRLHPGGPHRVVKHLLAEARVPPWQRNRVPLLFSGDDLIAVGDLYLHADHTVPGGVRLVWSRPPVGGAFRYNVFPP